MSIEMEKLSTHYHDNVKRLKTAFSYPNNEDFVVRELSLSHLNKQAAFFYLKGTVKEDEIQEQVFNPLLTANEQIDTEHILTVLQNQLTKPPQFHTNLNILIHKILNGHTVLIIEGNLEAIVLPTMAFAHRTVGQPEIEAVLKGPKEAFLESSDVNRSLIRRTIKNQHLLTETITIGDGSTTDVSLMYVSDLVEPALVQEVKKHLQSIEADYIANLSILEQYIEDNPYSLVPTVLLTERPDRAAAFLDEGHIVLIMDNSPDCLVAPVTFWSFFQTAEDQYQRFAFGNLIRIIRLLAFFMALFAPAVYLATTNYHVEMIPTDLLLTISSNRGNVPLPAVLELVLVEIMFDVIREAGTRMPSKVGPVVAIVAAFIVSYATITAGLLSPVIISVVGIASLASYAIPTNSFNFAVRIARFGFIALAAVLGFLGIALGVAMSISYMSTVKSFGVPFISPLAPYNRSSSDLIFRRAQWKQWVRPMNISGKQPVRGKKPEGGANS
ncbi:spore germination protein [Halalkalibacter krulwichiae]|uniref:Spore germination protein A1 n=1 Tax=Halalkalibacter krulwichiae TaxID=199441 RepID=A0A1X9MGP1_9BACI|nr:spore germination protein [Halalkalibacter krulwichiae]ARK32627.1 Spore germination protein A1 [Halalkalibacter krulwichiae]